MKRKNLLLVAFSIIFGTGVVVAQNSKKIVTVYTNGQGVVLTQAQVDQTCGGSGALCANEYKDNVLIVILDRK